MKRKKNTISFPIFSRFYRHKHEIERQHENTSLASSCVLMKP